MASKLLMLLIISLSSFALSRAEPSASPTGGDIDWWCNTTPYPEPCKYCFTSHRSAPKRKTAFRMMLLEATLDRAVRARAHILWSQTSLKNQAQRRAWADCLLLHEHTVMDLNSTLMGLHGGAQPNCTGFDAQTWLSAAHTNLETCRAGAAQLNVSDFITPLLSNHNVSELISNSLAVNYGFLPTDDGAVDGQDFPKWVTAGERRLLAARRSLAAAAAKVVVAQDGSGRFRNIQAAIDYAAQRGGGRRYVIYVKKGIYKENIVVGKNVRNIMLVGDGLKWTIITASRSTKAGLTTYNTATAGIDGPGFIARGIAFSNSAGPRNGQAVALRSASDLSVFYRCAFLGYQDTIFAHSQRQFYKSCYIYGTIDIIFGNAAAVFQSCVFYVRKPMMGQGNTIAAQGRGDPNQNTGTSIQNSQIRATPELQRDLGSFKTYLGRPWAQYSRTVIFGTYIGSLVDPAGWSPWDNSGFAQSTLYFGEYKNYGPSASPARRVRWPGYHAITNPREAQRFTVGAFISGGSWLPATGVPFTSGL